MWIQQVWKELNEHTKQRLGSVAQIITSQRQQQIRNNALKYYNTVRRAWILVFELTGMEIMTLGNLQDKALKMELSFCC